MKIELNEEAAWTAVVMTVGLLLFSVSCHHTQRFKAAVTAGLVEGPVPGTQGTAWVKPTP